MTCTNKALTKTKKRILLALLAANGISLAVANTEQAISAGYNDSANLAATSLTDTVSVFDNTNADTPIANTTDFQQPKQLVTLTVAPATGSPQIALLLNDKVNPILWQGLANRLHSPKEVTQFYAKLNYRPLWTDNGRVTPLAAEVIQATRNAYQHALRPEVYHTGATSSLQAGQQVAEPEQFDIVLSDAFITYKKHLSNGIVDPISQFNTWNTEPEVVDFVAVYLRAQQNGRLGDALSVNDADYLALQQAYVSELNKDTSQKPPVIPATRLKVGSRSEAVRILRERLGLGSDSNVYDNDLKAAVKAFQKDNQLYADGIAGSKTLRVLNKHSANHLDTLAINMERHRWTHPPKNTSYVWVNIPAYQMAVRQNNQWLFESDTIVGRPKRPTPVFSDVLEHVVLAPYWNVPKTIFKEDKLPKLRKNPNALGGSMQVINNRTGKVVNPASVDWSNGGKGYRLRQKPSGRNALGRMKFLFPNRHAIYLHDTPTRRLFKKSRRAYSSGCIRLAKAEDFALFLLEDMGYNRDRIKKESRRSREKWVNLNAGKQYPVFLNYYTAWVDSNQQVRYSDDVYRYDKKMSKAYSDALKNL